MNFNQIKSIKVSYIAVFKYNLNSILLLQKLICIRKDKKRRRRRRRRRRRNVFYYKQIKG
jgi:hypothetical protein